MVLFSVKDQHESAIHIQVLLLPGKSHGWRSLMGCSPWGHWELDTTQWLHLPFSLSCTGEGNGNLLQCSYLQNPRDGRASWAVIYGVGQSRTWLKRLSSSSRLSYYTAATIAFGNLMLLLLPKSDLCCPSFLPSPAFNLVYLMGMSCWQSID